jgi:hypothetical protein
MASTSAAGMTNVSQLLQQFNARNQSKHYSAASAFSGAAAGNARHAAPSLAASITSSTAQRRSQSGFAAKLESAVRPPSR